MDKMIVDEWMKFAENDLAVVHILSSHHPMQLEIICYHCQQAAEKALKAYLLYKDKEPPKTHDLKALVDLCIEVSPEFSDIITECEYLSPFGVQPRYPFSFELEDSDATTSIQKSEQILEFIKEKIIYTTEV